MRSADSDRPAVPCGKLDITTMPCAEKNLQDLARYVVRNPLRAGLVRSVYDYSLWDAIWIKSEVRLKPDPQQSPRQKANSMQEAHAPVSP